MERTVEAASQEAASSSLVLARLRAATSDQHRRLDEPSDERLDIVSRLADPALRLAMIGCYAALHVPADEALNAHLADVPDLDFAGRSRTAALRDFAGPGPLPAFPPPGSTAEALGMLYVLEGATLGGRIILRRLAAQGVADSRLAFLDPYGAGTGERWRGFIQVLGRETGGCEALMADACRGAVRAFAHAELVLWGGA